MSEFLEKRKIERLQVILEAHIGVVSDPIMKKRKIENLQNFIKRELDLAYRAGMIHMNCNDNTCLNPADIEFGFSTKSGFSESSNLRRVKWASTDAFNPIGHVKEEYLVKSYLISKGYE